MKTSELTGAALDWAVAKCRGLTPTIHNANGLKTISVKGLMVAAPHAWIVYSPRTDWAQGGPIIEREEIEIRTAINGGWMANRARTKGYFEVGPTPLIAATRCYVASEMGDEVEVPVELLEDGQAIGIDGDGNVICWDATKQEPYNSGENDAEAG